MEPVRIPVCSPADGVESRFNYGVELGGVVTITGEIGSGKSTALRYAAGQLHPAEYKPTHLIATSGSIMELYRQIAADFGIARVSKPIMNKTIQQGWPTLAAEDYMVSAIGICAYSKMSVWPHVKWVFVRIVRLYTFLLNCNCP